MQLRAPSYNSNVLPGPHDTRLPQRDLVVAGGHFLHRRAVQRLGLHEDHRVCRADACKQQPLCLHRCAGHDNLQAGRVAEVRLGRLRVVQAAVAHGAVRRAHGQAAHIEAVAGPVAILGRLVHKLVESREDVVRKLDFRNGGEAVGGEADGEARDALLRQRSVEHAVLAEPIPQPHRATEHTTKPHVLTKNNSLAVCLQRDGHCVVDRCKEVHFLCALDSCSFQRG
mmetsp:Transcript_20892/g.52919  ORF Transcript_20892/g.52919 Transcript_20892/m.52919 type:complete len:226 (+) Transcript_20892:373-1050(+)